MAGVSEVFNLDFKFGGNAEFLVRLENLMRRVDDRFESAVDDISETAEATRDMAEAVDDLNDSFSEGVGSLSRFGDKLKEVAQYYISFQALSSGIQKVLGFGMQSMDAFAVQNRAENQLKNVLINNGNLDQFDAIKDYAAEIQGRSIYGDEAMIRGAGELATYVNGTGSLKSMMNLLTDYAAGMTGGGEVSPEQMESLATGLGMAYDGNYMAMRRKGFDTSKLEALDALAENGGNWNSKLMKKYGAEWTDEQKESFKELAKQVKEIGGITEDMRVDALKEAMSYWQGLSDSVNELDSSALVRFQNKLGDLREDVGAKVYPVFNKLVAAAEEKLPLIRSLFMKLAKVFERIIDTATTLVKHMDSFAFALGNLLDYIAECPVAVGAFAASLKIIIPRLMGAQVATLSFTKGINMIGKSMTALFKGGLFALFIEGLYQIWRFLKIAASAGKELMHEREVEKARKEYEAAEKAYKTTGEDKEAEKTRKEYADWRKSVSLSGYRGDSKLIAETEAKFQERLRLHGDSETLRTKMEQKKAELDALLAKGSGVDLEKLKNDWGGDYKSILLSTFEDFNIDEETKKTAKDVDEALSKELKNGKVYMKVSNDNRTTNIKQEVKLAADIQKVGILLNQNIRALIEKQMRQNREVALSSNL